MSGGVRWKPRVPAASNPPRFFLVGGLLLSRWGFIGNLSRDLFERDPLHRLEDSLYQGRRGNQGATCAGDYQRLEFLVYVGLVGRGLSFMFHDRFLWCQNSDLA